MFDIANLQCEVCKNITPKHNAYICESGHTICINCDDNLNITNKEVYEKDNFSNIKFKTISTADDEEKNAFNLAGGDCIKRKSKNVIGQNAETGTNIHMPEETDKRSHFKKNFRYTTPAETRIVYKNLSYDNNESIKSLLPNIHDTDNEIEKINIRPITCPMLHCKRTVAFNSILKHFSFDHSEIPTLLINTRRTLKIYLKPISLSQYTKCVAIIKPIGSKSTLLLMAAKILHTNWTIYGNKQLSKNHFDSDLVPQNKCREANENDIKKMHEDIIIWICRLTEFKQVYCVKVKRDNIFGYSYIGEGLDIQSHTQDPISVFKSPECLLLRYFSIPKLLDVHGQIHVYINLLK